MTVASVATTFSLSAVALALALVGTVSQSAVAATPPPTDGPITVVVPATASPSPSPSNNGGGGGGSGETPDDDGAGAAACAPTNADGSPTPAATPKDDALDLEVDRERLIPGEWIITRSSDFVRGEKAQIVMYPGAVVIGSFTVDAPTGFAARFKIPEGTLVGQYQLEATGWTSCAVANNVVTIVSGPVPTPAAVVWWPYAVIGSLGFGLMSLAVAFRVPIAVWFAGTMPSVPVR